MKDALWRYRLAVAIGLAGFVVVLVTGLLLQSSGAVMWAGGVVGVATGIAIAATHREDNPPRG
ncbi:MAG: hypothetical protein IT303_10335 [Dehalococcoidia bacterium]|nr:hypothetical protein [Dehalococcoidia bacterium]